jgi:hypothetical protein
VNDEELAQALRGAVARDPEGDRAERWERLAAGDADESEREALARLAREDGDEQAVAALAPLDHAFLERVERRLAPPRRVPRKMMVAAALALAASIALIAGRPPRATTELPAYSFLLEGEEKTTRGPSRLQERQDETLSVALDAELRIELRPQRDVEGPIEVTAAIVERGRAHVWQPPARVAASGAVEIAGQAASLLGPLPGEHDLVIAVGRPDSVPRDADSIVAMASRGDVRVFRVRVRSFAR